MKPLRHRWLLRLAGLSSALLAGYGAHHGAAARGHDTTAAFVGYAACCVALVWAVQWLGPWAHRDDDLGRGA